MDYQQLIASLSPEIYQSLKRAVETGRWPDGRALTPEQRDTTLQALIAWGERHLPPEQRVGYIDRGSKAPPPEREATAALRWRESPGWRFPADGQEDDRG